MADSNHQAERERLQRAIEAQERLRGTLDEAVLDATLSALRQRLAELQDQPQSELQRKQVTVLFMDVVASTQIALELDPEINLEIMDQALERLAGPIEANGGRVARFMGDGFMAVFGAEVVHENDAEMAVRAAIGIQQLADRHARMLSETRAIEGFQVRIGVNTGLVALGGATEGEDTMAGPTVNLAARLEKAAPPGGILVSHDTYLQVRDEFTAVQQAPVQAKGFRSAVAAYLIEGPIQAPDFGEAAPEAARHLRLVGRDLELSQLQAAFESSRAEHRSSLVFLVGESGLGKSRLLDEFRRWLQAHESPVDFFHSRVIRQVEETPYAMLRDLFTFRFGIPHDDSGEQVRVKLQSGLARPFQADGEMKSHLIAALLGYDDPDSPHLIGVRADPGQLRDRGRHYLAEFVRSVATRTPTVILLDDVHWSDAQSLEVLLAVWENCQDVPLMVVCATRSDLFLRHPIFEEASRRRAAGLRRIDLPPLSEEACVELVNQALRDVEDLPDLLRTRILARSEGNPYYVEELIRILREDGVLSFDEPSGRWVVDEERLQSARVPPTLTAVLQARLDSLPAQEKLLLQRASIAGRVFWDRLVSAIEEPPAQVGSQLVLLVDRQMLDAHPESLFPACREFAFRHGLLHEVIYETVPLRSRPPYHAAVAGWLEASAREADREDEFAARIGQHYQDGALPHRAAEWFVRAGERSTSQGAYAEARRYFDRALLALDPSDVEMRWRALLGRNEAHGVLGEVERRRADDDALVKLAQQTGEDAKLAEAYHRHGWMASVHGDAHQALESFQLALAAARRADDGMLEAQLLSGMGFLHTQAGDLEEARTSVEAADAVARELGDEITLARTLVNATAFYSAIGDYASVVRLLGEQTAITHRLGNFLGESTALINLGYGYLMLGQFGLARQTLEAALDLTESIGARRYAASAQLNMALAAVRVGDPDEALELLEEAYSVLKAQDDRFGEAATHSYRGLALEAHGRISEAAAAFQQARQQFEAVGAEGYAADSLAGMARAALAAGRLEDAQGLIEHLWDQLVAQGADGLEFPALAFETCADVFSALDQFESEDQAVRFGVSDLTRRAEQISEPSWRQSYLEQIPEHRRLLKRSQAEDPM